MNKIKKIISIAICILMITAITLTQAAFTEVQEETASVFSLPAETVKSQLNACELRGNTVNQFVKNGDFCNGTNGWIVGNATSLVSNNTMTITGNGASYIPYIALPAKKLSNNTKEYWKVFRVRVTNPDCQRITMRLYTGFKDVTIDNPVQNQWYEIKGIITGNTTTEGVALTPFELSHVYADAATANGKVMEVQEVMAIDLTDCGLDSLTENECNDRFPNWLASGINSTISTKVSIESENRFNKATATDNYSLDASGLPTANTSLFISDYIKVEAGEQYTKPDTSRYVFYDINRNIISVGTAQTMTAPSGAYEIRIAVNKSNATMDNAMFVKGSTYPSTYKEYKINAGYVPTHSFNDGEYTSVGDSQDSYDVSNGVATQRNQKTTLDGTYAWSFFNDFEGYKVVSISLSALEGSKPSTSNAYNIIKDTGKKLIIGTTASGADYYYVGSSSLLINIADTDSGWGETYTPNQAEIQAYFNAHNYALIYQLATPVETTVPTTGLIAYPNGTVIIETAVCETGVYNSGISVEDPNLPIESIDWVKRINSDSSRTMIDNSNITISANGSSFTIDGAVAGEAYEYAYLYPQELTTIPTIQYSVATDQAGQIDGNTNMIQQHANLINMILDEIQLLRDDIDSLSE